MHHYPFHPADYTLSTVHLGPMEDLCYRRLLDLYYTTESAIPVDTQWVSRRLRMDAELVESVLKEFFIPTVDGWRNYKCDDEIANYQEKAETARRNGKSGGRPKKTQSVPTGNPVETGSKANQEPRTRTKNQNQEEKAEQKEPAEEAEELLITEGLPVEKPEKLVPADIIDCWNHYTENTPLPEALALSPGREKHIRARLEDDFFVANFEQAIIRITRSGFCLGQNDRRWKADIDWLIRPETVARVMEGKYDHVAPTKKLPTGL
jgi:uncharacterized protein YdaU (DUF1376 family)